MKLEPKNVRYLSAEDWRVLTAIEQGSRNHEVVPTPLINSISGLQHRTGVHKNISTLAKMNLISRVKNARYDGYRLGYGGLDYLALHAHLKSQTLFSIGNQIGMGKESDILVAGSPDGAKLALKIHRLGRLSFRTVKTNRDYLRNRASGSWMYMSRLAAMKEHAFIRALYDVGFPVPRPVAWNRHTVVMELIDAFPLRQVREIADPAGLYGQLIELILRLAKFGLIHGDFNEFNILIVEEEEETTRQSDAQSLPKITVKPIVIDFPQSLSISHPNAEFYFNRDVNCIKRFFSRRFHFESDEPGPFFADAIEQVGKGNGVRRLDVEVEASGFSKKMARELEGYMKEVGVDGDANGDGVAEEEEEDEDEDEEEQVDEEDAYDDGELGQADEKDEELAADLHSGEAMTVLEVVDDANLPVMLEQPLDISDPPRDKKPPAVFAKAASGWAI